VHQQSRYLGVLSLPLPDLAVVLWFFPATVWFQIGLFEITRHPPSFCSRDLSFSNFAAPFHEYCVRRTTWTTHRTHRGDSSDTSVWWLRIRATSRPVKLCWKQKGKAKLRNSNFLIAIVEKDQNIGIAGLKALPIQFEFPIESSIFV
jgi:hypothetical protein